MSSSVVEETHRELSPNGNIGLEQQESKLELPQESERPQIVHLGTQVVTQFGIRRGSDVSPLPPTRDGEPQGVLKGQIFNIAHGFDEWRDEMQKALAQMQEAADKL